MVRYDISVYNDDIESNPVILEIKLAKRYKDLETSCDIAINQISEMQYTDYFFEDGYKKILCYGIAFYRKQVRVKLKKVIRE